LIKGSREAPRSAAEGGRPAAATVSPADTDGEEDVDAPVMPNNRDILSLASRLENLMGVT
jgi:hypothetical protein